jgi:orotate phosphoribosyltransferase
MRGSIAPDGFDALAGAETAGIAFAAWLADTLDVPLRYVRKRPLGIGHNAQVEGGSVDGLRVLLVDDLTTDATSKLSFAHGLRQAGATVTEVLTIFYHSAFPGAADRLAQAGLTLHPLATWNDILRADFSKAFDAVDRKLIEDFLADPMAWSLRHGGRSAVQSRKR